MKRRNHIQRHPNQENKTGKATFASTTSVNSSAMGQNPAKSDMRVGEKGDYKYELLKKKK
jgi:hypothetical protein